MEDKATRELQEVEVRGGWKALCAAVLFAAVNRATKPYHKYPGSMDVVRKENYHGRAIAVEWLDGGVGTITYEDCCSALGYDPEALSSRIDKFRESGKELPRALFW